MAILNYGARSCHVVTVRVGSRANRNGCFFFYLYLNHDEHRQNFDLSDGFGRWHDLQCSFAVNIDELQVPWNLAMSFPMFTAGRAMSNWVQSQSSPTTSFNGLPTPSSSGEVMTGEQYSVGSLPDDDSRLAQVLSQSTAQGKTYKQAIEILNGVSPCLSFVNMTDSRTSTG